MPGIDFTSVLAFLPSTKNKGNINVPFKLFLSFDSNGKVSVTGPASAAYTITGNGAFDKKGDMWGNEKRDVLCAVIYK